jgi:putative restriction endonuclease
LKLINGGGRAEVEAAHIRPVGANGPDTVQNGLALSGTVHWMFDRGLISLSDELDILVSRQVNGRDTVWGLVNKTRRAPSTGSGQGWRRCGPFDRLRTGFGSAASAPFDRLRTGFLAWHREHCFKQ